MYICLTFNNFFYEKEKFFSADVPLFAGFLGTLIGAGGSIWVLAACTAGGFAYAACAASEVLKRMRALRIDGEYAKKSVAGDPHDHQELHH